MLVKVTLYHYLLDKESADGGIISPDGSSQGSLAPGRERVGSHGNRDFNFFRVFGEHKRR